MKPVDIVKAYACYACDKLYAQEANAAKCCMCIDCGVADRRPGTRDGLYQLCAVCNTKRAIKNNEESIKSSTARIQVLKKKLRYHEKRRKA